MNEQAKTADHAAPRWRFTRFHVLTAICGALALTGISLKDPAIVLAAWGIFLLGTGLGVAVPGLRLFGPFICSGTCTRRQVALTFDDGPDPRSTPAVLDILRARGMTAAFFCVGERVTANPDLAARMVREGHLLENHSYRHSSLTNFLSVARLKDEIRRTQWAIESASGAQPRWFRPPMGLSNPRVFRAARELGLVVLGWSARGFDTQVRDPQRVVRRITQRLAPGGIILLHDGNLPVERVQATLESLLDTLRSLEYEVVRLDRLLAPAESNPVSR